MTRDYREKKGALETILFAMGQSVPLNVLADAIGLTRKETMLLLDEMIIEYTLEKRGIRIIKLEENYQMCSASEYYEELIRVASKPRKHTLTDAMLEVLAIVAYQQPVTKGAIEKIRGVRCDHAINKLVEYELIEEQGRLEAPGRPILFGTTENFLRQFGFGSIQELPLLESFVEEENLEMQVDSQEECHE